MLLIDAHEPNIIKEKLQPIPCKVLQLKYGDYAFSDIIIERKTLSDFFSSLKNNRLMEQMENMSRFYDECYLLIEGFFDFSYVNNVDYLYAVLIDIMLNFDAKVIFSKDIEQTSVIIKKIYFMKNLRYKFDVARKDKPYYAVKLFGLSRKKLETLFSRFGSIRKVAIADKSDFKGIKTIGKRTVEKIKKVLDEDIFRK